MCEERNIDEEGEEKRLGKRRDGQGEVQKGEGRRREWEEEKDIDEEGGKKKRTGKRISRKQERKRRDKEKRRGNVEEMMGRRRGRKGKVGRGNRRGERNEAIWEAVRRSEGRRGGFDEDECRKMERVGKGECRKKGSEGRMGV
jgi:hypothetical protein